MLPSDILRFFLNLKNTKQSGKPRLFFWNPLSYYSSMIPKPEPTRISGWHAIMVSMEDQLFHIISFSGLSTQVLPFQLLYECAREMADCQWQHPNGCLKQRPRHKKKEKNTSQIAICTILAVLHIPCSCAFMMLYLSKSLCENPSPGDGGWAAIFGTWQLPRISPLEDPGLTVTNSKARWNHMLESHFFSQTLRVVQKLTRFPYFL